MPIPVQMAQALNQFMANPMQYFLQRRLNVPQGVMNDPQGIINHLLQTGQITQEQVNSAYRAAQRYR